MLTIEDTDRIRILTLDRPDALNAFSHALYEATLAALRDAATDRSVAVTVLTGNGRAFTAGADLGEMAERNAGTFEHDSRSVFLEFLETLLTFPKPLLVAVNGLAVGIGVTLLGYADLVFMSSSARLRCPFTRLGVVPEAGSSYLFPLLLGRQRAAWTLLSSEWIGAAEALEMGLVFKVAEPDDLMAVTMEHARVLASKPIDSLVASKRTLVTCDPDQVRAAWDRETTEFGVLLGGPANTEALRAFAEGREPDFATLDALPPD